MHVENSPTPRVSSPSLGLQLHLRLSRPFFIPYLHLPATPSENMPPHGGPSKGQRTGAGRNKDGKVHKRSMHILVNAARPRCLPLRHSAQSSQPVKETSSAKKTACASKRMDEHCEYSADHLAFHAAHAALSIARSRYLKLHHPKRVESEGQDRRSPNIRGYLAGGQGLRDR